MSAAVSAAFLLALTSTSAALATEVLVLNSERVLNEAEVGVHIREQLAEISEEMRLELEADGESVRERFEAWQESTADLTVDDLEDHPELVEEGQEIQAEMVRLNVGEQIKSRELLATRQAAMTPVRAALDSVLEVLVEERGADILIERAALIFAAEEVDITEDVISRLNAELTEVDVERIEIPLEDIEGEGE